jgi:4-amino-4-deoxy-L-arabinose transferase-like glycosyltransferase
MTAPRTLLVLILVATIARAAFVWLTEPSPGEAYYYLCSQRLAPAYFDGPAGTALLTEVASVYGKSDVIWRMTAPLWSLIATCACFGFIRQLSDARLAAYVALLLNILPIFNSAALRLGPELSTLTFVTLGLLAAWRASGAEAGKLVWWVGSGLFFGLATCFAYAAIAIVPGVIAFAMSSAKRRRSVDFYGMWALLGIPALCLAPALVWNASNDWIPIAGGTFRTLWEFDQKRLAPTLSALLVAFSPLLFAGMIFGWFHALIEARTGHVRARFAFWSAAPCFLIGAYFLLRGSSAVVYFLIVAPLLLFKAMDLFASKRLLFLFLRWAAVIVALAFSAHAVYASWQEGRGWRAAALEMGRAFLEKSKQGQDDLFLIAEDEKMAAVLGYHLRDALVAPGGHPTVYVRESQDVSNQFALWPTYGDFTETDRVVDEYFTEQQAENPFLGRSALYITHERDAELPQTIRGAFDSVILFREVPGIEADTRPLYIYLCLVYQTLPL